MDIARVIADRGEDEIVSVDVATPMREAVALLAEKRIGALPVMEAGRVVGIFSERDLVYCLGGGDADCLGKAMREVMTSPPITVDRKANLLEALSLMTRRRIRHLPVLDGEAMCGFISIGDLVKARLEEVQSEAKAMRDYIQTA